jgi:hypothetical protein
MGLIGGLVAYASPPYHAAMRKILLTLGFLTALGAVAAWWFRDNLISAWRAAYRDVELAARAAPKPDPVKYAVLTADLQRWRKDLAKRHREARDEQARAAVEQDARILLELTLPEMMRCWLGTPWDFNGTAAKPGGGGIACGYYVATVLMDAGFRVDRYQLAKQPSENILRSFLTQKHACILSVGKNYETFAAELNTAKPGIYLVGLDTHVAFIVKPAHSGFRFIHSSGSKPWRVVDESPAEAVVLQRSNWRMLGNLTADPAVIRRWLRDEKITVKTT